MGYRPQRHGLSSVLLARSGGLACVALAAFLLMLPSFFPAQDEDEEVPPAKAPSAQTVEDAVLPQIAAVAQSVTTPDVSALSKALHVGEKPEGAAPGGPPNTLTSLGDLDGDGVPEMVLKWAIPDAEVAAEVTPAPDSGPLWAVYLLCWDGARWKASRLVSGVEDFTFLAISLGKSAGQGIAVVTLEGDPATAYPALFQIKDHAATLLWDAQADDSRYAPLIRSQVNFRDSGGAPAEMIVTGRADPGLLQFERNGHRGFNARAAYRWDGKAYMPAKTEYFANRDYTLYRFVSALHLHDFRSAYALIAPGQFLSSDSPTLEAFRHFIQDTLPEFLDDHVFEAPEPPAGSPEDYVFVLPLSDKQSLYHPTFSSDGKFLLTGLKRTEEALPVESPSP
jgi:hypothetical protein